MGRRSATGLVAGLALVLLAGCSGGGAAPVPTTTPTTPTTTAIALPAVRVAVADAGAQPRALRTLDLTPGAARSVTLTTTSSITQTVGEQAPQDLSSPDVTLPVTAVPGGDGDVLGGAVALTLGTPTTADEVLTGALAGADGSGAGLTQAPSGALTELRITPSAGVDDRARAAVEQSLRQAAQLAPVLPEVAVGVGAVWSVTETTDSLGLLIDQVSTYTLTSVQDRTLELGVTLTQTPQTATWDLPGQGGTLDVVAYPVTGSGSLTVDLGSPLPVAGAVRVGGDQVYSDPASGLVLRQSVQTGVRWG